MKNIRLFLGAVGAMFLAGCGISNRSYLRDNVATLPSGDIIAEEAEYIEHGGKGFITHSGLVWRRNTGQGRLLAVEGQPEMWVHESGRVLTVKGDREAWGKARRQGTADELHVSTDGNRAWLTRGGRTVASFDYDKAEAIFGEAGQPAWVVDAR